MKYVLIHRPRGVIPENVIPKLVQLTNIMVNKPEEVVPNAKLVVTLAAQMKRELYSLWETDDPESLVKAMSKLCDLGYDTEVVPVESGKEFVSKYLKQ